MCVTVQKSLLTTLTLLEIQQVCDGLQQQVEQLRMENKMLLKARTDELTQSHSHWRSLFEYIQLAVVALDTQGKVNYANPFLLNLIGYTAEEVSGKDWVTDFVLPSEQAPLIQYFQNLLSLPGTPPRHRSTLPTRSRQQPVFVWNNILLHDAAGRLIGTLSIGENVTEKVRFERTKNDFMSIVSHELRTPLTAIYGGAQLLSQGSVASQSARGQLLLEVVAENSQRLVRLVNDISALEYLATAKNPLQCQTIHTQEITRSVVDAFGLMAAQAGIELTLCDAGFDCVGDRDRLIQVLTNLLENALKFSPAQSTIQLAVEELAVEELAVKELAFDAQAIVPGKALNSHKAGILFKVQDQGSGIACDQYDQIFNRFVQVDSSTTRKKGGTGLGLALCRSIVELHGGRIWVKSIPGEGSCFYFTVPISRSERSLQPIPISHT
jgi:PAS domain S-box-containing protein